MIHLLCLQRNFWTDGRYVDDLAELVRGSIARHPHMVARLGPSIGIRRYWLDFDYPVFPPPLYERSGIEIAGDYIAWSTMPVDSLTVSRVRRALWPTPMFQAVWAFITVQSTQNLTRIGTVLGRETKPQPTFEALVALHKARSPPTPTTSNNAGVTTVPTTRTPDPSGAPKQPNIMNAPPTKKTQPIAEESEKPIYTGIEVVKPSFAQIQEHMKTARIAFRQKFNSVWTPPVEFPSRGSIFVSGLVEIGGKKGLVVLEVRSFWDPKTKAFDIRNTRLELKRFQPTVQRPRGGN